MKFLWPTMQNYGILTGVLDMLRELSAHSVPRKEVDCLFVKQERVHLNTKGKCEIANTQCLI